MSEEAEYEQWLDAALAFEANWRSPSSSYDSQDEIVDRVDSCWPEDLSEEWFRLDSSGYRDRRRALRLRGRRTHKRLHIHVRQKLWRGARAMALLCGLSHCACAQKRRHRVLSRDLSPTHWSADTASATASTLFTRFP